MCVGKPSIPRGNNKEGLDEKHVEAGVAFTTPKREAPETVLRIWKKKSPAGELSLSGRAGKD